MMSVMEQVQKLEEKDWVLKNDDLIVKKYTFDNHLDGANFANKVSVYAEAVIHHPEIRIGYKEVTVGWRTYSEDGLTEKDIAGAKATDRLFKVL